MDAAVLHDDPSPREGRPGPPACPCCGGPLFRCRGAFQCARCRFQLCEDCQGPEDPPQPEG